MPNESLHFTAKDILKTEVALALGCTEPVAVALSSAAAASLLPGKDIESIQVWVDINIYKNGGVYGYGGIKSRPKALKCG